MAGDLTTGHSSLLVATTGGRTGGRIIASMIAVLLLALLMRFHVGFQASDDASYLNGALGWINAFPYVGDNHWTLRHTVTIPTAAFIRLFGLNEFAVSLSGMCYFIAFIATNAWFTRRYLGAGTSAVASLLLIAAPGFVVVSTYLNPDIPELFFASSAFWTLRWSIEEPERRGRWLLGGVLVGLAFMTRQTSVALVVFVGLLAVFRPLGGRSRYATLGLAALAVMACEWLYLTSMTGNPTYRWSLDFHHDAVDRFAEAARVARSGILIDKEGLISVNVFVDPFLNLFFSQKYGLLFWLLIPASIHAFRRRREPAGLTLALVAAYCAISFFSIAANPKLYLVPRYFVITAWGAALVVAWWLDALWREHRRLRAGALLGAALLTSGLALAIENISPRFVEKEIVRWTALHPNERVYTDIETRARSEYFLRFAGLPADSLLAEAPPPGARFFYNKERVAQCAAMSRCRDKVDAFRPSSTWQTQQTIEGPRRPIAAVADLLGLKRVLPPDVAQRIDAPIGLVTMYRVR